MSLELEDIEELPPELTGALTFHLPLELAALELAGADPALRRARAERRLAEAYRVGLVDPPLYRWAVGHYRPVADRLIDDDPAVRRSALPDIESLAEGLAGAAFHGLIRLGYGLWRRRPAEVARGLAYLRSRRQVLATGSGPAGGPTGRPPLPEGDDLAGLTVFDLMNLAAGSEDREALRPGGTGPMTAARLCSAATGLVARNPSSFVSVHTVTGLHGLYELHRATAGALDAHGALDDTPLAPWWQAYTTASMVAAVVVHRSAPEAVPAPVARADTPAALLAAAVASGETHDVKLVLALTRLAEAGLVSEEDLLRIGAVKLAATECRAH